MTTNDTATGKPGASRTRERKITGYATMDYVAAWLVEHGDSEDANYGLKQFIPTGALAHGRFEMIARKAVDSLERLLLNGKATRRQRSLLASLSTHLNQRWN